MTSTPVETETIRRIHIDGHCIEVGEWPDAPGFVELRTVGAVNVEYFGPINLTLPARAAKAVGQALVEASYEQEGK